MTEQTTTYDKLSGALGWAGIAAVAGGIIVRFTMIERQEIWYWSLIAGIVLILAYGLTQWREVTAFFRQRHAQYGAIGLSSVVIGLGIVIGVNYVLARQNVRWDLTAAQQYSLSPQTVRILESLESPVRMTVFAQDVDFPAFQDRLGAYEYGASRLTLEFVDPEKDPVRANQYEVQAYGTVVLEYQGRTERVVSDSEQEVTNALIKVIEGQELTVYFVQGHGERLPTDTSEPSGFGGLGDALRLDNLTVETLVLAQTGAVPEDAAVVVVAGPETDYFEAEVDLLRGYLEGGGSVLLLLDPSEGVGAEDRTNLIALAAEWGIDVGADVVVDVSGIGQLLGGGVTVPVAAPPYPPHPITADFGVLTAFPLARSVTPQIGGANGRQADTFVETSANSWAETSMEELAGGEVEANDTDPTGPISIAAAVSETVMLPAAEETPVVEADATDTDGDDGTDDDIDDDDGEPSPPEARLAVIGDADFASNAYLGAQGNRDLVLNTINWLAQQENLIAIRPRQPEERRITVTAAQQFNLWLLSFVLIPGGIIGAGVAVWWRRRG